MDTDGAPNAAEALDVVPDSEVLPVSDVVEGDAVSCTGEGIGVGGGVGLGQVDGGLGHAGAVEVVGEAGIMIAVGATNVFEAFVAATGVVGAVTMEVLSMFKKPWSGESSPSEVKLQDG